MSVTDIPIQENLQGPWAQFRIMMDGTAQSIGAVYPFMSLLDIKRLLWIHKDGDPRWSPEHVFLCERMEDGSCRSLELRWPFSPFLPDPRIVKTPSSNLVDETGNRKPVTPKLLGTTIVEDLVRPNAVIEAISLSELMKEDEDITAPLLYGYIQLYFPWITEPKQVRDSTKSSTLLRDAYAIALPYMLDRTGRISVVESALKAGVAGTGVAMQTMVKLRWTLPEPAEPPVSLEKTFYSLTASETIPFLRFFPVSGPPILKVALTDDGRPLIEDKKVFLQYLSQPPPVLKKAVIMARIPIYSEHVKPGTAFIFNMFDTGAADITLDVPQRGVTYTAAVAADAQLILADVLTAIGFPADLQPTLKDIHATYKWKHPNPRSAAPLSAARIQTRVASLTPFLEVTPILEDEKALTVFRWTAVSNYTSESIYLAFVDQLHSRSTRAPDASVFDFYRRQLEEKFKINTAAATSVVERWAELRSSSDLDTGAMISLYASHPEYSIEVQDVHSSEELQRIMTVMGVLLGASQADLALTPPASAVQTVAAIVKEADAVIVASNSSSSSSSAAAAEEDAAALDDLLGDLGFSFGGDEEEDEGAEAAIAAATGADETSVAAAVDTGAVADALADALADGGDENECRGIRWMPGEAAVKMEDDYYMEKLKKYDTGLFGFNSKENGKSKGYSKSCQRRDDRQPNILTLSQYARVRRCYEGAIRFVMLPPQERSDLPLEHGTYKPKRAYAPEFFLTDPVTGRPMWTFYTYQRVTEPKEFLFLMSAELWCERDNIPLIRSEYESEQGRGFTKPKNTCPFCGGRPFAQMDAPKSGESVIVRKFWHPFIGVMKNGVKHPKGYELPCCDLTPRLLRHYMDLVVTGSLTFGPTDGSAASGVQAQVQAPSAVAVAVEKEKEKVDYRQKLGSLQTQYIIGSDKSIDAGKIALLPPALDAFFGQSGPKSLITRGIRPTFADGAALFLRLGVDYRNRDMGLNLFAALAPLLGKDSAEEAQAQILKDLKLPAFEAANYGTLVTEFAARSHLSSEEAIAAATAAGYPVQEAARPHIARLFKAWTAFQKYLRDPKEPKQLRHMEHLLAHPGSLAPRGLLLIVLEINADGSVHVVCPSFGIPPASVFGDVPISFLWHDTRTDSWEPLIFYNGTKDAVRYFSDRSNELASIPKPMQSALRKWLRDWRSSSQGCGRPSPPPHVWTPDKDTVTLPHLSQMRRIPEGLRAQVRDRSNRLAGVLVGSGSPFYVPCLDDGTFAEDLPRIYEAAMIPPVSASALVDFYTRISAIWSALRPVGLKQRDNMIVGVAVESGTLIPCSPINVGSAGAPDLPVSPIDQFAWERDALILKSPDAVTAAGIALEESKASVEEQMDEAYEYLRLRFSKWLADDAAGLDFRDELGSLLDSGLPLFEKRKRLDILLEPHVSGWVTTSVTEERKALSLLRSDCISLPKEQCTGVCRLSGEGTGDRCLIHAPTRDAGVSPVRIFTAKLSDELLRYSAQQRELLTDRVLTIRAPKGAVRIGDELYLATKSRETAADVLRRLGFADSAAVTFPEEILTFAGAEEAEEEVMDPMALPMDWTFELPSAALEEDPRGLSFAAATGKPLSAWAKLIDDRRRRLGLPTDVPFNWSLQDLYVIASLTKANLLFVERAEAGIVISQWVSPPATDAKPAQPVFMIFWGPAQMVLTRGKSYIFLERDLPVDLRNAIDAGAALTEEEARGFPAAPPPSILPPPPYPPPPLKAASVLPPPPYPPPPVGPPIGPPLVQKAATVLPPPPPVGPPVQKAATVLPPPPVQKVATVLAPPPSPVVEAKEEEEEEEEEEEDLLAGVELEEGGAPPADG